MIPDNLLIERAIRNAKPRKVGCHPRWAAVAEIFACGSTTAKELCQRFGFSPDDQLQGRYVACPECGNEVMDENGICPECS